MSSLKYKLWRRRMSISSSRMAIRTHRPWPIRALFILLLVVLVTALAYQWLREWAEPAARAAYDGRQQLASYKEQLEKVSRERDQLSATVNAAESQLNIERAAQKQLLTQVRGLESDNTRLKEDLAFFESLLPNATGPQGISIRRVKVDMVASNQLRYRLLVMQGGASDRNFVGNLQLAVTTLQEGKSAMIIFPESHSAEQDKFKLSFKHYQRVEGILTVPEGAVVKLVQARVLEKGQIRAQQAANL